MIKYKMDVIRTNDEPRFIRRFSTQVLGTSFFRIGNNEPELITITVRTTNSPSEPTALKKEISRDKILTFLGIRDQIIEPDKLTYHNLYNSKVKDTGSIMEFIKSMIRGQIKYNPNELGEPFTFLVLDKNGESWSH